MAQHYKQYALGKFGELLGYEGKKAPEDSEALVEEDGKTLTPTGLKYFQKRGYPNPTVEALRVIYDQYHAQAVGDAIKAQALNADLIREKQEKTKIMSERLRLDWEAQDKAFKAQATAKK